MRLIGLSGWSGAGVKRFLYSMRRKLAPGETKKLPRDE